jgi:NADH-quinone oxidoreductase subunit J
MAAVFFFIAGIGAIVGAVGVATLPNPFYSVLALVCHLLSLAALFLLLRAEFIAAAQVVVYAGAVMVLYVFVVAYVGGQDEPVRPAGGPGLKAASIVFAGLLAVELLIAVLGSGLKGIDSRGAAYHAGFGSPAAIGELLLTRFLFPFEAASFLLLIAAVGAVVLARRRGGLEGADEAEVRSFQTPVPAGIGTIAEGVGDINPTATIDRPAIGAPTGEPARATEERDRAGATAAPGADRDGGGW